MKTLDKAKNPQRTPKKQLIGYWMLPNEPHPSPTPHTPQGYPPNQSCVHSNASHTVGGADKMPQDGEHRIQYPFGPHNWHKTKDGRKRRQR